MGAGDGEGFLLSNKPVLRTEVATDGDHAPPPTTNPLDRPSNPFLVDQPLLPGAPSINQPPSASLFGGDHAPLLGAGTLPPQQQQKPWEPNLSYVFPAQQNSAAANAAFGQPSHATPLVGGATNPLLGMDAGVKHAQDFVHTNPFLADTSDTSPFADSAFGMADSAFSRPANFNFPPPTTMAPPPSAFSVHPEPSETTPPPATVSSTVATPPGGVADWSISQDLCQKCVQQFQELDPVDGRLNGDKAKEFFIRSKLPSQELSAIW